MEAIADEAGYLKALTISDVVTGNYDQITGIGGELTIEEDTVSIANDMEVLGNIEVDGYENLVRDTHSNAIINTSRSAYEAAVLRSKNVQKQKDELRDATREINILKSEMHEIKNLLVKLVEKDGR